ncbi:MAG: hypothetical protein HC859_00735 [Bacteroidia bacterium]|nr:hypothetical protein [Bacteroidia bacterium]
MKYTLDNGWTIERDIDGAGVLHVKPLPNSIFRKEQYVLVSIDVIQAVENGERSVQSLFKNYDLHKQIIQWKKGTLPKKERVNTPTKYQGVDFFVTEENDKYYLEYLLSTQGGKSRKFEISKEIYEEARMGKYSTSELFKKYDLYHLDVPENDVK